MDTWVLATLAAALFQTVRFMLQKRLATGTLSAAGATFARFAYAAPPVLLVMALWALPSGRDLPGLSPAFWAYAATGGLAQIFATLFVVRLFAERNFAVGITFKKTEVIQTALVGWLILGEGVSLAGFGAILIGFAGVLVLSRGPGPSVAWWRGLTTRASLLGLGSGVLFAISGVTYRGASLEIEADPALRAAMTLAAVLALQAIAMGAALAWRDPAQLRAVWAARRVAVWVGAMSLAGSFCWFLAFTLQNAAYVNALGQVEMIFSVLASILVFRETIARREIAGMALVLASVLVLVLVA